MTDDDKIVLGEMCETLFRNDLWSVLTTSHQQDLLNSLMLTKDHHKEERERIFQQLRGFQDFLNSMKQHILTKEDILKQNMPPSKEDAVEEEI